MSQPSDRDEALRSIEATYERYRESGYADKWRGTWAGYRLAVEERDRWIASTLARLGSGTVVDVGCGGGALGMLLDAAGTRPARLLGFDLLDDRLDSARANVPWGEFSRASADALPIADATADVVVAMTLLSSLVDEALRTAVLREIARVVRPGGAFVVYDLRYPSPGNRHVRPVSTVELRESLPGWTMEATTLTLLPPLARSPLARGRRAYRLLAGIPVLRSHLGVVLVKPA